MAYTREQVSPAIRGEGGIPTPSFVFMSQAPLSSPMLLRERGKRGRVIPEVSMDIDIYSNLGPWDSGILWGDPWSGVGGNWALPLALGCIYLICGQVLDDGTSIYSALSVYRAGYLYLYARESICLFVYPAIQYLPRSRYR